MTFKPIPDWPGYFASDDGQIKSTKYKQARILKQAINSQGRAFVNLSHKGKTTSILVHKLVCLAFLGPAEGRVVRHLDGDRTNNNLINLCYGTQVENLEDARKHGTLLLGERTNSSKLTERHVRVIRGLKKLGFSAVRLSELFDVHKRVF